MTSKPRGSPTPDNPRRRGSYVVKEGDRFGRLVVMGPIFSDGHDRRVKVRCDCGKELSFRVPKLFAPGLRSCGCARGKVVLIEHEGRARTMSEWARDAGITVQALSQRLEAGGTLADALSAGYREFKRPSRQEGS